MRVRLEAPLDDPGRRALARALEAEGVEVRVRHTGPGDAAGIPDADRAWLCARADDGTPARVVDAAFLARHGIPAPAPAPRTVVAPLGCPGRAAAVARAWIAAGPPEGARLVMVALVAGLGAEAELRAAVDVEALGDATLVADPPADRGAALIASADLVLGDRPEADLMTGPAGAARAVLAALAREAAAPVRVPAAARRTPLVAITGDVASATSLGALSRGLARALVARGDVEVALVPDDAGTLTGDPAVAALLAACPPPRRDPDVTIRNGHPPRLDRAAGGRQVHWLHWEFGPPPRAWLEGARLAADEVWLDSAYARDGFVAAGLPAGRAAVVPPGVDPDLLRPGAPAADLGDAAPGTRFLFVGGLVERKGADLLLEAHARAFGPDDDATLVIKRFGAGGPYARTDADARAERMAADPSGPRVRIADGPVTDAAVAALYAACDCLVHPYRGEAFGMTMLEAMAAGLAVIAPDRGAARAFMDHSTAILVPAARRVLPTLTDGEGRSLTGAPVVHECDADDLAAAMRLVHDDRGRARAVGRRAAARARGRHTWAHTAEAAVARIAALTGTAHREVAV